MFCPADTRTFQPEFCPISRAGVVVAGTIHIMDRNTGRGAYPPAPQSGLTSRTSIEVAAASRFVPLCEAACEQNGVAQTIGTVLPPARQAPQACDCERPFRSLDILRRPADADRAHLTVGPAMISARSPVCSSPARSWQRPGPMQKVRPRFAIFWLLLLACLALSAADVAWACQSPDQARLPSQANMLADGALDPKGVASPSDGASAAVAEQALKSSCLRCRCLRLGYERLGANKSRTECANLARAPPSA